MKKLVSRKDSRVIDLLIAYGPMGYGIYALLVEYLHERKAMRSPDDLKRIAYELHADAEILRAVVEDFGLFYIKDGEIHHGTASYGLPKEGTDGKLELSSPYLQSGEGAVGAHDFEPLPEADDSSEDRAADKSPTQSGGCGGISHNADKGKHHGEQYKLRNKVNAPAGSRSLRDFAHRHGLKVNFSKSAV